MNNNSQKRNKLRGVLTLIIITVFFTVIAIFVGKPMLEMASNPERFRIWIDDFGIGGRLAFIGMVILQNVVAIIPGEPLELCAGYAFGAIEGTILCLIASVIGSVIVFCAVRSFGIRIVELFFDREKINSLRFLQNSRRLNLFAFIFTVIPGTPKDMLAYFVGLTKMKLSTWVFITAIGRIPSIVTSTMVGDGLGEKKYITAAVVFVITLAISLTGLMIYRYICKKMDKESKSNGKSE